MEKSTNGNLSLLDNEFLVTYLGRELRVELHSECEAKVDEKMLGYNFVRIGEGTYSLLVANKNYLVTVEADATSQYNSRIFINGRECDVTIDDKRSILRKSLLRNQPHVHQSQTIKAPMPGLVARVEVQVGQQVKKGQGLVVLEAMKMENEISAVQPGKVEIIHVTPGKVVEKGEPLVSVGQD